MEGPAIQAPVTYSQIDGPRSQQGTMKVPHGVSFHELNVHGYTDSTDHQKSMGNLPLFLLKRLGYFIGLRRSKRVAILQQCNGVVHGGEMLLVLGRPGSGCTTFLRTIAGETCGVFEDAISKMNYQGVTASDMKSSFRGECSYLAELDVHFPTLTVGETLDIAARARPRSVDQPSANVNEENPGGFLGTLGLSRVLHTKVGNDYLPGLSGGERKRLSIAEVLLGQTSINCWDNSTRGLDSSNALAFMKALRDETDKHCSSAFVTLYQSSQTIYQMFDKVMLLYEGRQVYFGDPGAAKSYFEGLGFLSPERMATPEFLTSMTNPDLRSVKAEQKDTAPLTAEDFAQLWHKSPEYEQVLRDIDRFDSEYPQGAVQNYQPKPGHNTPYAISIRTQVLTCIRRGLLRLRNDLAPPLSSIIGNCILSVILGTVFYDLSDGTDSFFGRAALLFFTTLLNAFASGFEPGMLWEQRPIVEKHYRYAYFHPFADAIAAMICDLPNKILTSIVFNVPVYYLSNLRRTAGAFFTYWVFSFACLLTMSMIFRTIGSMSSTLAGSMAPVAIFMLMLMIYTGFTLPMPYMHPWFRWFHFINPVGYTFESLMINEVMDPEITQSQTNGIQFGGRTFNCSQFVPSGPTYEDSPLESRTCNVNGAVAGQQMVAGDSYIGINYEYFSEHLWRNFGVLVATMIISCFMHLIASEVMSVKKSKGDRLIFRDARKALDYTQDPERTTVSLFPVSQTAVGSSSRAEMFREKHITESKWEMGVSSQPATLIWDNLSYNINLRNATRLLLDDLEGWVLRGTLTALMGVSGAGKTTLLNVLANRASTGVVCGDVNPRMSPGKVSSAPAFGYAQQQDIHLATSTVREALRFSALLRQPTKYSESEKLSYVEEVVEMLRMTHFADAVIGVPGEGLNEDQRKRLTIGVELAARPELLIFLDEPTSGLDSDTAWAICSLLRRLADQGQAILCTLHQPSAGLFGMFDRLVLLSQRGQNDYFGDVGQSCRTIVEYFESHGARPCRSQENPAEWLMDVTDENQHIDWATVWQKSAERKEVKSQILLMKEKHQIHDLGEQTSARKSIPARKQLFTCTVRLFSHYWRTPSYISSKALLCTLTALFIGFSFWKADNSLQGLQNQIFGIFLLLTTFTNLDQQIIGQYTGYRNLYEAREAKSASYSWPIFVFSSILVETPWQTIMSIVLFVCWYYPIGMYRNGSPVDAAERGSLVFLTIWSFMMFVMTSSFAVVAGMESGPTAVNIAQLFYSLSLIFCGVLVPPGSLPRFWKFMYRISPLTYFTAALGSGAVGITNVTCASHEILRFKPIESLSCGVYLQPYISARGGYLLQPGSMDECEFCLFTTTDRILRNMGVNYNDRWRDLAITLLYSVVNIGITLLLYWFFRVPKKPKVQLQPTRNQ